MTRTFIMAGQRGASDLGFSPPRLARLVEVLESEIERERLPGAVALIARHGKLVLCESMGLQDPERATPMALDSVFRIYSMTKPIVSVAVLMLMEQGRLLLSDPVAKYLPEFKQLTIADAGGGNGRPVKTAPTLQDLLRHTAGFTYGFTGDSPLQMRYREVFAGARKMSNEAFCRKLAELPLVAEPGTVWEYSHATDVLGRVIEVVGGHPLGVWLRQQIFEPLAMHETAFFVPPEQHHRIAEAFGHNPDGGPRMAMLDPREVPTNESGGGGLVSTALDYARFLQFMLKRGTLGEVRLLGSRTVDWMTADHLGPIAANASSAPRDLLPEGNGFGLGFAVRTEAGVAPVPGSLGSYYWGGIGGTTFFVDPKEDMFALMMIQAPNQRDYYRPLFRNLVYAALVDAPAQRRRKGD
ncbi:MAG: serine hydrolase domain-containing protein [Burkholderiales bacterium]